MSDQQSTHGLACPRCGGMVPIPEGELIVRCPYCDLRSLVRGERGLQRYQVPQRITREAALVSLKRFLSSSAAVARDAGSRAQLEEVFLVQLPFWVCWAQVLSWVFGQKKVGSGKNTRYEPREVSAMKAMNWNGAACDVGEFGVSGISLEGRPLEAFDPDLLHARGLVFEPVGSVSDAAAAANQNFQARAQKESKLDRISQVFLRQVARRMGIVYYPMWVVRYAYQKRTFQVVVDAYSGEVLFGKAPGSVLYRAAMLVGGMAGGAYLAVDGGALALYLASQTDGDAAGGFLVAGLAAVGGGFAIMSGGYNAFRYGEQYEFQNAASKAATAELKDSNIGVKEIAEWLNR